MLYLLFWLAFILLALATLLYPPLLWAWSRWCGRDLRRTAAYRPDISVVVPFGNAEETLARKINNLLALQYPQDKLQVILVADGSTDRSEVIAEMYLPHPQLKLVSLPEKRGLAAAWNAGVAAASGEVVLLTDAVQLLSPDCLLQVVPLFADPQVGGVTGGRRDFVPQAATPGTTKQRVRLKYLLRHLRYYIKVRESRIHSVTEPNEALFAFRKSVYQELRPELVLPGTATLLRAIRQGFRVVFEPRAVVLDTVRLPLKMEVERYRRIFAGYFQFFSSRQEWLPRWSNNMAWLLLLHNWLRLLFPFLLLLLFVTNLFIADAAFYYYSLLAQLLLIGLCLLSLVIRKPLLFYLFSRANFFVLQQCFGLLLRQRRPLSSR